MRVFLELGVYYVLPDGRDAVAAQMGLRSRVRDAWLLPDWIYVFVGRLDLPTDGKKLVLHAPGTLVYVLLAVWAVGAVGVMVWKIGSHLAFRRRILKNAVPVTTGRRCMSGSSSWNARGSENASGSSCAPDAVTTPLSIGLYNRTTRIVLPMRASIRRRSCRLSCGMRSFISPAATRRRSYF